MDPTHRAAPPLLLPLIALVLGGWFASQILLGPSLFGTVEGITLRPASPSYRVGETVSFLFEYRRADPGFLSCFLPWGLNRLIESDWHPVVSNACHLIVIHLHAGDRFEFEWRALTATDHAQYGLATVEPGIYRVTLPVGFACDDEFTHCSHRTLATMFWIH